MAYKVVLSNSVGVLDVRSVETEEETRAAALDLISGLAYLAPGDAIRVLDEDD